MSSEPESPAPAPPSPRRRFRLSLRALMILVLVVGGGLGWTINHVQRHRLAVAAVQAAGGTVQYDWQFSTDPERRKLLRKVWKPAAPAWLRQWLGDELFQEVASVSFRKPITPEILRAVGRLDGLEALTIDDAAGLGNAWGAIEGLGRLEEVMLFGADVNDSALAAIGRLSSLRGMILTWGRMTDAGFASLGAMPALRSMTVASAPDLTDAGVARGLATGFPTLEEFRWVGAAPSVSATVRALAGHHPRLRELTLSETSLDEADLARIGGLAGLSFLHLPLDKLPADLAGLELLGKLERVSLKGSGVGDAGMKSVGKCRNLRTLDLTGTTVGDAGVAELAGLERLTLLLLGQTAITDASAEPLARLAALERLTVPRTKLTDAVLVPLRRLGALRLIQVGGTAITPAGAAAFQADRPGVAIQAPRANPTPAASSIAPPAPSPVTISPSVPSPRR